MQRTLAIVALALASAGTACKTGRAAGGSDTASTAQAAQTAPGGQEGMSMPCPMSVPGTQVAVAETQDGEAVTFTTTPDRAAELRTRVHAMADMHNRHHQGGEMQHGGMHHGGMMGRGSTGSGDADAMPMMPPASRATVEDVEGGARLVVTPDDPADLDRLRSVVRMHAEHMQHGGTCEMGHHGKM